MELYRPQWSRVPGEVSAAQSCRRGGTSRGAFESLNLSFSVGDDPACVAENRQRLAEAAGFSLERAVQPRMVHGNAVWRVVPADAGRGGRELPDRVADALVTDEPGLTLMVTVADCVPVFLAAGDGGVVGVVHAGWRGVVAGVLPAALDQMKRMGAETSSLAAAFGPSIGRCCMEVGHEVAERFAGSLGPAAVVDPGAGQRPHLDLHAALRAQLEDAGVDPPLPDPPCSQCRAERFFSHRAAGGRPAGRMLAAISRAPWSAG